MSLMQLMLSLLLLRHWRYFATTVVDTDAYFRCDDVPMLSRDIPANRYNLLYIL